MDARVGHAQGATLVVGGTGKTGRRVVDRLHVTDGVERALGRRPRDFPDSAHAAGTSGVWGARGAVR